MSDNKVKYDSVNKLWICLVCNKTNNNKYNMKQIMNHVKSAHGENGPYKPDRKGKGKLIENKEHDIILQMEHEYGRIKQT